MLLLLLFLVGVLQISDPFTLSAGSLPPIAAAVLCLGALAHFYSKRRPRPAMKAMLTALQQMIVFTAFGSLLSYMLAARGGEYWDARLYAWDQALGLDWEAYIRMVNDHPLVGTALRVSYQNLIPQTVLVIVGLGFANRLVDLRTVTVAAILAGMVTICMSGFTPALDNFVYLGLNPADFSNLAPSAALVHVDHVEGLRAGTLRHVDLDQMEGIITFPSYHAALAVVYLWGFSKIPILRWPGVAMALLTILATPIDGGHYFVDVLAGILIALASIACARKAITFSALEWWDSLRTGRLKLAGMLMKASPFRHSHGSSVQ